LPIPRARNTLLFVIVVAAAFAAEAAEKSILVVGDSLSAAYGIAQARGWVALLGERLQRERPDYSVVNASISGDTTAAGAARLGAALEKHRPAVVIIELGANDGLRGQPVAQMKKNLAGMIERAKRAGARVLLVGMKLPPNYGRQYTEAFAAAFGEVARQQRVALVPFLFESFAEKDDYFQPDRIHPTAAAQPLMLDAVWKRLQPLLR
jgi:acyl-CoA thioesterase I